MRCVGWAALTYTRARLNSDAGRNDDDRAHAQGAKCVDDPCLLAQVRSGALKCPPANQASLHTARCINVISIYRCSSLFRAQLHVAAGSAILGTPP